MARIQDRVAIVTGGASGLGKAIATLFVQEGAFVTITDVNETAGREAAKEIGAKFLLQDVSKESEWRAAIPSAIADHGRLDILVNNAGIGEAAKSAGAGVDEMRGEFLKKIPLGEFGDPKDIAYAALYLASDESRHVTGEQLVVDGGMNIKP